MTSANAAGGTVTFNIDAGADPGCSGGVCTITLSTVDDNTFRSLALAITDAVVIDGASDPDENAIIIDADGDKRHFYVSSAGHLTLNALTLQNGLAEGEAGDHPSGPAAIHGAGGGGAGLGGAIFVDDGALTVLNSTLVGNTAQGGDGGDLGATGSSAGGDPNGGTPTAGNGGFGGGGAGGGVEENGGAGGIGGGGGGGGADTNNNAQTGGAGGFGGGNGATGSVCGSCGPSTFGGGGPGGAGAGLGGAIFNRSGTVTLSNSTLSGNVAQGGEGGFHGSGPGADGEDGSGLGGAVFNYSGTVDVENVTFSDNTADEGGGIFNLGDGTAGPGTVVLDNTIVANSNSGAALGKDFSGDTINTGAGITSGTGNLIESALNFTGTIVSTSDPALDPLADNGGFTETHALQAASPAIDAGDNSKVTSATDQRGFTPRIVGGTVDIGTSSVLCRLICHPWRMQAPIRASNVPIPVALL